MVTRIYIIRHCEADGNVKEIFQGHTDGDITEKGKLQLELLSERCKNLNIDAIYSSPLQRAYKTALAVGKYHPVPILKEKGIIEINGGKMEGKKWSELPVLFPAEYPVWKNNFPDFQAPDGESVKNVYDRMKESVMKIVSENVGKTVILTTHGGFIYTFLAFANNIPPEEMGGKKFWCENTSVSCVDFEEQNGVLKPNVIYMNDYSHLNEETSPHKMFWRKNNFNTDT